MAFILGLILGAATLVFVFQNMIAVPITFLGWHTTGNLTLVLAICVLAGVIVSWLISLPDMLMLSDLTRRNSRLAKELDEKKLKLSETEGKLSQAEKPLVIEKTVVKDDGR